MAEQEVPEELAQLVEKMHSEYLDSELAIASALAEAEGPLEVEELVEATGYTKRTVKKRVDSLEDRLQGPPLLRRTDDGQIALHPRLAAAYAASES